MSEDDITTETMSSVCENNHYVENAGEVYRYYYYESTYTENYVNYYTHYGCKCIVTPRGRGDELVGIIVGRYEDDYPENDELDNYWYIRVNIDYDLQGINGGLSTIPSYDKGILYGVEWVKMCNIAYDGDSDHYPKIISMDPHPSSFIFEHDITRSSEYSVTTFEAPPIKLKCLLSGVYVLAIQSTCCANNNGYLGLGYKHEVKVNDNLITNDTSIVPGVRSYGSADYWQKHYCLNLKSGDIVTLKHVGGTATWTKSSSTTSTDVEWDDDTICTYGYCDNSKNSKYIDYYLHFCFWNYALTTNNSSRLITSVATNRNDNFEVIS